MYDMYIAEALIENDYQKFDLPEKKEALIDQVLEKHKISEARWDTSLSWYSDNIDQYIQQDLAPFRQAKERAQKSNKFDYVAPIIIIEGIKFYEKHLLKCFA